MCLIIALCKIYCPLPHCVHENLEDGRLSAAEGFLKAVCRESSLVFGVFIRVERES